MTSIESIAFDLEGTVVNVEHAHHQGHIRAAKDVGVELTFEDCFKKLPHFIGGPDDQVAKEISELAALNGVDVDYEDVLASKRSHYDRLLKELEIEPRPGFMDFFNAIKEIGMKYAIGSLTIKEHAQILLEKSGLGDLFGYENIVLREHVKNLKPAPDVWLETARRTNVEPHKQLVFEDSPRGIKGAMEIGAYCIGMPVYNREDTITDLVKAGAKRIFMNWDEIKPLHLLKNINHERQAPPIY